MKPIPTILLVLLVLLAATPGTFAQESYQQQLNGALPVGGNVSSGFQVSPDNSTVVYRADQDTDGVTELYSVPIGGGPTTRLNDALASGCCVFSFQVSPDGSTVVYRADQDTNTVAELYSVTIGGGPTTKWDENPNSAVGGRRRRTHRWNGIKIPFQWWVRTEGWQRRTHL